MTRRLGSLSFALGQMALSLLLPLAVLAQRTSGPPPRPRIGLALEGGGRTWSVLHNGSPEQFHRSVLALGGEIVESRGATLEEIFLARAGRRPQVEAT